MWTHSITNNEFDHLFKMEQNDRHEDVTQKRKCNMFKDKMLEDMKKLTREKKHLFKNKKESREAERN